MRRSMSPSLGRRRCADGRRVWEDARCGCDSTSPTTAPTSTAGRRSRGCAPCRACSRTALAQLLPAGGRRRSRAPAAPTPACTRAARWCTSTSTAEVLAAAAGRSRDAPADALLRRLNGVLPADVRVRRVAEARRRVRRAVLGAVAALRLPDRRRPRPRSTRSCAARAGLAAAARRRRDERGGRACSPASTTSPRSASGGRARRPSARCSTSSGRATRPACGRDGAGRRVLPPHGPRAGRLPGRRRRGAPAARLGRARCSTAGAATRA